MLHHKGRVNWGYRRVLVDLVVVKQSTEAKARKMEGGCYLFSRSIVSWAKHDTLYLSSMIKPQNEDMDIYINEVFVYIIKFGMHFEDIYI
jgi:hypothetical protein